MTTIKGSLELAKSIKNRRKELNLTIVEAASKAGVGTKTWSRYESGESIRSDKIRGVCKVLNWSGLPEKEDMGIKIDFGTYKNNECWSPYLMKTFGKYVAASFVIGIEILIDEIDEDMEALSSMPQGSHIGEIEASMLEPLLPTQFLMKYDYDFLYALRNTVLKFRMRAPHADPMVAHSVIEELVLYLIVEESRFLMENMEHEINGENDTYEYANWDGWIFDIFDDMDIVTFLYSDWLLVQDETYHFSHWFEEQFYCACSSDA
ncbi:MAG: helix-turn-helix domain-containing protein [Firmicutes bacterium]|nr:helix-turn-helix domain-containing protein [Bacillota bacterium]